MKKCIIIETSPERTSAHTVTNEDGTPHIYPSVTEARAELKANGYSYNRANNRYYISGTEYRAYILREDDTEYRHALETKAERKSAEQTTATAYEHAKEAATSAEDLAALAINADAEHAAIYARNAAFYAEDARSWADVAARRALETSSSKAATLAEMAAEMADYAERKAEDAKSSAEQAEANESATETENAPRWTFVTTYDEDSAEYVCEIEDAEGGAVAAYQGDTPEHAKEAALVEAHIYDAMSEEGNAEDATNRAGYAAFMFLHDGAMPDTAEEFEQLDRCLAVATEIVRRSGSAYGIDAEQVEALEAFEARRAQHHAEDLAELAAVPYLEIPYQSHELEAYLGEPADFDVQAIEAEATTYTPEGRRIWKAGIDLAAIAERHAL